MLVVVPSLGCRRGGKEAAADFPATRAQLLELAVQLIDSTIFNRTVHFLGLQRSKTTS